MVICTWAWASPMGDGNESGLCQEVLVRPVGGLCPRRGEGLSSEVRLRSRAGLGEDHQVQLHQGQELKAHQGPASRQARCQAVGHMSTWGSSAGCGRDYVSVWWDL